MKIVFKNGSMIQSIPTPEYMATRSIRAKEQTERVCASLAETQIAFQNLLDPYKMATQAINELNIKLSRFAPVWMVTKIMAEIQALEE